MGHYCTLLKYHSWTANLQHKHAVKCSLFLSCLSNMQGSLCKIYIRDGNKTYHEGKKKFISKENHNTFILCPFPLLNPTLSAAIPSPHNVQMKRNSSSYTACTNPCKARYKYHSGAAERGRASCRAAHCQLLRSPNCCTQKLEGPWLPGSVLLRLTWSISKDVYHHENGYYCATKCRRE